MASTPRLQARPGQRALIITTLAVPLTGWTVHALSLHRRLAAARRDPLTGLLGRDGYTAKARQIIDRYTGAATVVICDLDHVDRTKDEQLRVSQVALTSDSVRDMQLIEGGAACLHPTRSPGTSSQSVLPAGGGSCLSRA